MKTLPVNPTGTVVTHCPPVYVVVAEVAVELKTTSEFGAGMESGMPLPPFSCTYIHCPVKWTVSGKDDSLGVMSAEALNQTSLPVAIVAPDRLFWVAHTSGFVSTSVQVCVVLRFGTPGMLAV